MSILTKKEREGLEDVFLSIKTSANRYERMKSFLSLWVHLQSSGNLGEKTKKDSSGKFRDELTKNFNFFTKVKKNLSE